MITKTANSLFFLAMLGIAIGVSHLIEMERVLIGYLTSFSFSFMGAYSCGQKYAEDRYGPNLSGEFSSLISILAGLLGVILFGLCEMSFSYDDLSMDALADFWIIGSMFFLFIGWMVLFCASLFYDENTSSRQKKEKNVTSDNNDGISFFLSLVGTLLVACLYVFFVLYQETIPSNWEDDYVLDNLEAIAKKHGDFLSYSSENYFSHLPWVLVVVLFLSLLLTLARKKILLPVKRVFGLVLFVGSFTVIINFPALLIHFWQPYVWFFILGLLIVDGIGVKILITK